MAAFPYERATSLIRHASSGKRTEPLRNAYSPRATTSSVKRGVRTGWPLGTKTTTALFMGAQRTAVIIGAGPAGLTAALELIRCTDVRPIVIEASDTVGGISRTVNFNGYRMDIGGHRFFSRSDWVMDWWLEILPLEAGADPRAVISYRNRQRHREFQVQGRTARQPIKSRKTDQERSTSNGEPKRNEPLPLYPLPFPPAAGERE